MTALSLVFVGMFGLAVGSFLNVVIYRVPTGKSLMPDSRCPRCDSAIKPWHNIPLLSWLALRGRCASCEVPIPVRYPIVEALTGVMFITIAWWWALEVSWAPTGAAIATLVVYLFLASASIALAAIDIDTQRLPNSIVYPTIAVMVIYIGVTILLGGSPEAALRAFIAAAVLFLFYAALWFFGGMGLGDAKLAVALGLALGWVGWSAVIVGVFAAFVIGGLYGVALMLARRAGRRSRVPFGPWMLLGAWVGIVFGDSISHWYLTTFFSL